jgi:hypothetical protein
MIIKMDYATEVMLTAWQIVTKMEFMALADVTRTPDGNLLITNAHVLDVGSFVYTEASPEMQKALPPSNQRRCWIHRHPIDTWSGTDNRTIDTVPCGSIPEMIGWSVSIVRTPGKGWIGRVDFYKPNRATNHLLVEHPFPSAEMVALAAKYIEENSLVEKTEELRLAHFKKAGIDFLEYAVLEEDTELETEDEADECIWSEECESCPFEVECEDKRPVKNDVLYIQYPIELGGRLL